MQILSETFATYRIMHKPIDHIVVVVLVNYIELNDEFVPLFPVICVDLHLEECPRRHVHKRAVDCKITSYIN